MERELPAGPSTASERPLTRAEEEEEEEALRQLFDDDNEVSDLLHAATELSPVSAQEAIAAADSYVQYADDTREFRQARLHTRPSKPPVARREFKSPPQVVDRATNQEEQAQDEPLDQVPAYEAEDVESGPEDDLGDSQKEPLEPTVFYDDAEADKTAAGLGPASHLPQPPETCAQLAAKLRPEVKKWSDMVERGRVPEGVPNEADYTKDFLLMIFRGVTEYAHIVTRPAVESKTDLPVLEALSKPIAEVLHLQASRFEGRLDDQRGFVRAASDPTVHFRTCFRHQPPNHETRVFYARSGHAAATVGGNVVAESKEQLARYLGVAMGKNGFKGRGYQYALHKLFGRRQFQFLFFYGSPNAPNPHDLSTAPSVGTYHVAKLQNWAREDPETAPLAELFEGMISLRLGGLNQHALLRPLLLQKEGIEISPFGRECPTLGLQRRLPGVHDSHLRDQLEAYKAEPEYVPGARMAPRRQAWLDALFSQIGSTVKLREVGPAEARYRQANFYLPAALKTTSRKCEILQPGGKFPFDKLKPESMTLHFDPNLASSKPVMFTGPPDITNKLFWLNPTYTVDNSVSPRLHERCTKLRAEIIATYSNKATKTKDLHASYQTPWDRFARAKKEEKGKGKAKPEAEEGLGNNDEEEEEEEEDGNDVAQARPASKGVKLAPIFLMGKDNKGEGTSKAGSDSKGQGGGTTGEGGKSGAGSKGKTVAQPAAVHDTWKVVSVGIRARETKSGVKTLRAEIRLYNSHPTRRLNVTRPNNWQPPHGPKWTAGLKLTGFVTTTAPYELHVGKKDLSTPVVHVGNLLEMCERSDSRKRIVKAMRWARNGGDPNARDF